MAVSRTLQIAFAVAAFGTLAFIFGVIAENKKPPAGNPITGKGIVICKYPSDPSVAFGSLSIVSLFITAVLGVVSVYYPYEGKSIPTEALFQGYTLRVFFVIAMAISLFGGAMLTWATVTEGLHRVRNVHRNLETDCPTAKTGLYGGAAFLALDACLFWLVCLMLTKNNRADYLEYVDDPKGNYGQVVTIDYNENRAESQPYVA